MTKKLLFSLLMCVALTLSLSPLVLAAPSQVIVYLANRDFIIGSSTSDMEFVADIENISEFKGTETELKMIITPPSGSEMVIAPVINGSGYAFRGNLPQVPGVYNVRYSYQGSSISASSNTPTRLTVSYRVEAQVHGNLKIGEANVEIRGSIYDKAGYKVNTANVRFEVPDARIISSSINNGDFTLRLETINKAGKDALALHIDGVSVKTWDVEAGGFAALTISPGVLGVDTATSIFIDAQYNEGAFQPDSSNYGVMRSIDRSTLTVEITGVPIYSNSVSRYDQGLSEYSDSYYRDTFRKLVLTGSDLEYNQIRFQNSGIATFKISNGLYTSTVQLPVEYGTNSFLNGTLPYQSFAGDSTIELQLNTPGTQMITSYSATFSAPGTEDTVITETVTSGYLYRIKPFTFTAMGQGNLSVNAILTDRDGVQSEVSNSFSYARPYVEISQSVIQLGQDVQISIYVRDAEGRPITNGRVFVEGVGSRTASQNGEYVFRNVWSTGGFRRIQAFAADGSLLVDASQLLKVQVPEVLTLTTDISQLVAGISQTIRPKVLDESGRELTGARIIAYIDNSTIPTYGTWNGREYSLQVLAQNKVVIHAESSDGRKASPAVEILVAKPVVHVNVEKLTAYFGEHLEFTFSHPSTGEAISGTIALRGQNVQIAERNASSDTNSSKTGKRVGMDIYVKPLNSTSDPKVIVDFTYLGRTYTEILTLPVEDVNVTITPEVLRQGVTEKVTMDVQSANGKALEGVKVTLQGASSSADGATNNEGRVSFNVKATSTVSNYTLVLQRNDAFVQTGNTPTSVEYKLPVQADETKPVLTIISPANITGDIETENAILAVELKSEDDFALDTLNINGQQYTLEGTSDTRTENIQLKEGVNTIIITLRDKTGLEDTKTFVVIFTPKAEPVQSVTMTIGSTVVRRGTTVISAPPLAPQIINGRTMLPFRYLVETVLEGMVNYYEATREIVAYVNGHEVKMTVDSNEIYVDGVLTVLDQEPIVQNGSTLAPVRAFQGIVDLAWSPATSTVTIHPQQLCSITE